MVAAGHFGPDEGALEARSQRAAVYSRFEQTQRKAIAEPLVTDIGHGFVMAKELT